MFFKIILHEIIKKKVKNDEDLDTWYLLVSSVEIEQKILIVRIIAV